LTHAKEKVAYAKQFAVPQTLEQKGDKRRRPWCSSANVAVRW